MMIISGVHDRSCDSHTRRDGCLLSLSPLHLPGMDDGTDTTTVEIANLLGSPKPPSQQAPQSTEHDRTLEEILAQSSTELIHTFAASINESAVREASKTEEFRQGINAHICWFLLTERSNCTAEFKRRLIRSMMRTYVWSTARLGHETEASEGRLARGVQDLLSAEREQGRSSPARTMFGSCVVRLSDGGLTWLDKIDSARDSRR